MLLKKLEDLWVAITFAEAGDPETAKKLINAGSIENYDPEYALETP